jgi:hypothetical protein
MRKVLIVLAVTVIAFTGLAGVAAADDPNPYINGQRGANYEWASCTSRETVGVLGQYGAQGFYIDGCTSPRVYCPWGRVCVVNTTNYIDTRQHYARNFVTQNARVRVFNSSGYVRWHHDKSCGNTSTCWNHDSYAYIYGGESATSQCNGVRDRNGMGSVAWNYCEVKVTYL